MLTAAVRDLHRNYPNRFVTDIRTSCDALWENNPYVTRLDEADQDVETIHCEYPLIHSSNTGPWHFIHGFHDHLAQKLNLGIRPTEFRGDIHLGEEEKIWMSQVQEITEERIPFWIVNAGGKKDFSIKWWHSARYQRVIDHFRKKILFVQIGEAHDFHHHPPLDGVLDLRGKTDPRQLVRLVHHAEGILCPVTLVMHLAAAVETRPGQPRNRACVVIAGGREPSQWEAYPHHQFIHRNGAFLCCDNGGCWKSRTVPLGDGDAKDNPDSLCIDVLPVSRLTGLRIENRSSHGAEFAGGSEADPLPRCMDSISVEEVIHRIELYYESEALRYLIEQQVEQLLRTIPSLNWK
jgi:hypothetical protein